MNKIDEILKTPHVRQVEVGKRNVDGEVIYRFVFVYGNDNLGYVASSEEWFSPNLKGGSEPEFYEVCFQTEIHKTADSAQNDAMPDAEKEARKDGFFAEIISLKSAIVEPTASGDIELNASEFEITDGYVGSFGKTYATATDKTLAIAIAAAAERHGKSVDEVKQMLVDGHSVEWCDSPNHYYDHGTGVVRQKRQAQTANLVKCSCGHSVQKSQVMNANFGTSCPDCYDRMS